MYGLRDVLTMGNVMAATPVAGPTSPVVAPPVFVDEKPRPPDAEPVNRNPGTVEDLHKKCKGKCMLVDDLRL